MPLTLIYITIPAFQYLGVGWNVLLYTGKLSYKAGTHLKKQDYMKSS